MNRIRQALGYHHESVDITADETKEAQTRRLFKQQARLRALDIDIDAIRGAGPKSKGRSQSGPGPGQRPQSFSAGDHK